MGLHVAGKLVEIPDTGARRTIAAEAEAHADRKRMHVDVAARSNRGLMLRLRKGRRHLKPFRAGEAVSVEARVHAEIRLVRPEHDLLAMIAAFAESAGREQQLPGRRQRKEAQ